ILGVSDRFVSGSDNSDRMDRDDNIAICWHLTAVDNSVKDTMINSHHCPFAGNDLNMYTGSAGDFPCHRPSGVYHQISIDFDSLIFNQVVTSDSYDAVPHSFPFLDFKVVKNLRTISAS